ncbi:MAG: signal transduction histidine kinase nitrogen specific NtrB [Planctomycetota bacterium]|nr:MAG: signal transduction histidine kinase nitrogen specific NtrB [Planctomycetota bacterium]
MARRQNANRFNERCRTQIDAMWKKIVAPAVVVSLCWMVVGGLSSYFISWQDEELDRVMAENVGSIRAATEMQETLWRMQAVALDAARQRTHIPPDVIENLERQFETPLLSAEQAANLQGEKTLVRDIREKFTAYRERWLAINAVMSGEGVVLQELLPLIQAVSEPCERLLKINEQAMQEATRERQQFTVRVLVGRAIMLIVGPGLGLWLGFRLAKQLHQSMSRISVRLQAVAGDLEQEVGRLELTPLDDLPAIQNQIDVVADRIRDVMLELHQTRREAMRSERLAAVGELAAGVAHELRNPLTSVKLLIQSVQYRLPPSLPERTFDVVLEEIDRMETTIQSLLDFARPPRLHRSRHDLRQIVQRAINLTEGRARQSGVVLTSRLGDEPLWVNADAEQLHQVCINLLLNGIESMSSGGEFQMELERDVSESFVRARFLDSGRGIPDNVLPRLFEPFTTSKDRGTGLGLAVSRRIVTEHSGRLLGENRPEGGAAFTLELPLETFTPDFVGHVSSVPVQPNGTLQTCPTTENHAHAAAG